MFFRRHHIARRQSVRSFGGDHHSNRPIRSINGYFFFYTNFLRRSRSTNNTGVVDKIKKYHPPSPTTAPQTGFRFSLAPFYMPRLRSRYIAVVHFMYSFYVRHTVTHNPFTAVRTSRRLLGPREFITDGGVRRWIFSLQSDVYRRLRLPPNLPSVVLDNTNVVRK